MPCCSIKPVSAAAAAAAETHHDWRQNPAPHSLTTPGAGMVVFATTSPSGPTEFAGWSATQQAVTELDLGSLAMRACLGRRRIKDCIYCDARISYGHEAAGMGWR